MSAIRTSRLAAAAVAMLLAVSSLPLFAQGSAALALQSARVTLSGTSNIHAYTAASDAVRLTSVKLAAAAEGDVFDVALKAGGLEAFAIAVPVTSLKSAKGDIDKNMHKALLAEQHPDITFTLNHLEPAGTPDTYRAVGVLSIAGTAREVPLTMTVDRAVSTMKVRGEVPLDMTEFGVKPPRAMLGMLKTDPKVTVRFEAVLAQ